jgi:hypothetical protein
VTLPYQSAADVRRDIASRFSSVEGLQGLRR